eukprot:4235244-Lingulodinium_polyedra.AAC.1
MEPSLIVEFTRAWGATLITTASPDFLLYEPGWAGAQATRVPVGGDGDVYMCQAPLQDEQAEEPTVVA